MLRNSMQNNIPHRGIRAIPATAGTQPKERP